MIGLADCNNFFVSCERTVHPELEGKPVVVLSNNDGCIVARSNEAKKMGIKMGQPAFEVRDLIKTGKLIALSGHHLLYKAISIKVHEILRLYAPKTIDYSVDEAFLLMDGIPDSMLGDIGMHIHSRCMRDAKIPVTVGFSHTKTLAKIATEKAKKELKPVSVLKTKEQIDEAIDDMPISDLWGIGRRLGKQMYQHGIFTVGQLAARDVRWVRQNYGVNGERTWRELHGEPCIELDHVGRSVQDSISESRTFPMDVDDFEYLRSRIAMYTDHCAKRLRTARCMCRELTVMLRTNRFRTDVPLMAPQITVVFDKYVSDTHTLVGAALQALERIFNPDMKYKRGGVLITDIRRQGPVTPSLFENPEEHKVKTIDPRLSAALDRINRGDVPVMPLAIELTSHIVGHNDGYSSTFQFRS